MTEINAYPLTWPTGWKRSPSYDYKFGAFRVHPDQAVKDLLHEIDLLGGENPIISSNMAIRKDGKPYIRAPQIVDPGVAVWFDRDEHQQVIACDTYDKPWKNIRGVWITIRALRDMQRQGASEMLERAFTGFIALPSPEMNAARGWREAFGFAKDETPPLSEVKKRFHHQAKMHHPDQGGNEHMFKAVNEAWQQAKTEMKGDNNAGNQCPIPA